MRLAAPRFQSLSTITPQLQIDAARSRIITPLTTGSAFMNRVTIDSEVPVSFNFPASCYFKSLPLLQKLDRQLRGHRDSARAIHRRLVAGAAIEHVVDKDAA